MGLFDKFYERSLLKIKKFHATRAFRAAFSQWVAAVETDGRSLKQGGLKRGRIVIDTDRWRAARDWRRDQVAGMGIVQSRRGQHFPS